MQFTEMSLAIFLLYLAVSNMYITSVHMKKGWKTNVRDSYINPGVYLIHAYCSTLQHKNQRLFHGMPDLKDFIFSLRSTRSLVAPIEKSEIKHLKKKRKKWYPPSFMVYLLGLFFFFFFFF